MKTALSLLVLLLLAAPTAFAQPGPLAMSENLGGGCAPYAYPPQLTITPPVLGGTVFFNAIGLLPQTPGELWVSPGPPTLPPSLLGGLCPIFLDLGSAAPLTSFATDGTGQWNASASLPADPALAGQTFTLQAAFIGNIPVPWPLPVVTTNGVKVTLGY